jgi:hypothetical protein
MKDYVDIAGHLGVSHILGISQTENNVVIRLARTPTGPTIHFRVQQYSLARLVRNSQKKPYESTMICTYRLLPACHMKGDVWLRVSVLIFVVQSNMRR